MTQTYTSDHHLSIEIEGHLVTSQYKGNRPVRGFADDDCCIYIGLVFEDLTKRHRDVADLKEMLHSVLHHLPPEEADECRKVMQGCG